MTFKEDIKQLLKITTLVGTAYPDEHNNLASTITTNELISKIKTIGFKNLIFSDFVEMFLFAKVMFDQYLPLKITLTDAIFFPEIAHGDKADFTDPRVILLESYIFSIYSFLGKAFSLLMLDKDKYIKLLGIRRWKKLMRIAQTRNKVIQHNLDPREFGIKIKPLFETAFGTSGDLIIIVRTPEGATKYDEKQCSINVSRDYCTAEEIFWHLLNIIK